MKCKTILYLLSFILVTLVECMGAFAGMQDKTEPKPDPVPENIVEFVKRESKNKDPAKLIALAESFESVVDAIDNGTITTVDGAIEMFLFEWNNKGTETTPTDRNGMAQLVEAINRRIDKSTLITLQTDYTTVAIALREVAQGEDGIKLPAKLEMINSN